LKTRSKLKKFIFIALASSFGLGLSPIAPGSFGALLGVIIHVLIYLFIPIKFQLFSLLMAFILVCLVHFYLTPWAVQYWQDEDPKHFVLDEVAGYLLVAVLFYPIQSILPYVPVFWKTVFFGFILFRILDIIKVPPARQIDKNLHNAWGIILDDLVSAVYAVILLSLLVCVKLI
jgi:phosphatidylglycerophosphatase A